jgi:ADP-heptose:LPS heptosyltransferase
MNERIAHPQMEYYRHVYKDSKQWDKSDLTDKSIIVYCEQGFGDIIQFLRYVPMLKQKYECHVILHCPSPLKRLVASQAWGVDFIDKKDPNIPEHDFHVLSMELPFLLDQEPDTKPYLHISLKEDLPEGFNIGICWESGESNNERDCPLKYFKKLGEQGNLIALQHEIRRQDLIDGCADWTHLFGFACNDFLDTAKAINAVDVIVSVDTAILHLAGAMGKHVFGLLHNDCDARWQFKWYENIHNLKGDNWEQILKHVTWMIQKSKD